MNRRYETGKEGNFVKLVISKKMCNLSVRKNKKHVKITINVNNINEELNYIINYIIL